MPATMPARTARLTPTFGELFTPKLVTILRGGYTRDDLRADALAGLTVAIVALPGLPLIPLIYASQVVNAVLLPLHVIALQILGDDEILGVARSTRRSRIVGWIAIGMIVACVGALTLSWARS